MPTIVSGAAIEIAEQHGKLWLMLPHSEVSITAVTDRRKMDD